VRRRREKKELKKVEREMVVGVRCEERDVREVRLKLGKLVFFCL